ncbi:hypothetical protein CF651_15750 [Paenibacillus rigui]|uniref:Methyltransferase type 11 domain-containing protein n=1 Tax=Paenibacillus rigui TaxID=554312 RepID=A0A229UPE0_9BACL|nr:hypothetical protein CF651_15750 [Paenibacillus rigui]
MSKEQEEAQKQVWDRLWSAPISYAWDRLSEIVLQGLKEAVDGDFQGKRILEAGSGTGKISLRLALEGAQVTLVDYSKQALEQSRFAFRHKNVETAGAWVLADIREIPLEDDTYDMCWNAGVLEHFGLEEKVRILKEMCRLTRPGGKLIVLVPYSLCLPYRLGKGYAEAAGSWPYGTEVPVASLQEEFRLAGLEVELETNIGFVQSLDFLDFIPGSQMLKQWAVQWYDALDAEEKARLFPGYLLLTAGRVKPPVSV